MYIIQYGYYTNDFERNFHIKEVKAPTVSKAYHELDIIRILHNTEKYTKIQILDSWWGK